MEYQRAGSEVYCYYLGEKIENKKQKKQKKTAVLIIILV